MKLLITGGKQDISDRSNLKDASSIKEAVLYEVDFYEPIDGKK